MTRVIATDTLGTGLILDGDILNRRVIGRFPGEQDVRRTGGSQVQVTTEYPFENLETYFSIRYSGANQAQLQVFIARTMDGKEMVRIDQVTSDIYAVFAGNDEVTGNRYDDSIRLRGGNDRAYGQDGRDNIFGDDGNDRLYGGAGGDELGGGSGDDVIEGGDGVDRIVGHDGRDTLFGGAQDDSIWGGSGDDSIDGGSGRSMVEGGDGNDRIRGGADPDILSGQKGNDSIDGGGHADRLFGNTGRDTLTGGTGNDQLTGGRGADLLDPGSDTHADVIIFKHVRHSLTGQPDRIVNFETREDRFDLSEIRLVDADRLRFSGREERAYGIWFETTGEGVRVWVDTTGDAQADMAFDVIGTSRVHVEDFLV